MLPGESQSAARPTGGRRRGDGARVVDGLDLIDLLHHGGGPHPRQLHQIRPQPGVSEGFLLPLLCPTSKESVSICLLSADRCDYAGIVQ